MTWSSIPDMPPFVLAGANLDVFPFNHLLRHSGFVYVRRSTSNDPVYRCALRWHVAEMIRNRRNLCWSIEGGRTRTGKLRSPAYGLLRYVIDALDTSAGTRALIVPISIVYEQLHEVPSALAVDLRAVPARTFRSCVRPVRRTAPAPRPARRAEAGQP
ncbi:MAG: 1-acyl-sn-glycerol-3-phosphate acyltransferase [Actinoplanes sp.]